MELRTTGCCGVLELVDISTVTTPADVLRIMQADLMKITRDMHVEKPFIYFTSVTKRAQADHASSRTDDYGKALADYIEAQGIGEVVRTLPERVNFSGNTIKMWLWQVDYDGLRKFQWPFVEKCKDYRYAEMLLGDIVRSENSFWRSQEPR